MRIVFSCKHNKILLPTLGMEDGTHVILKDLAVENAGHIHVKLIIYYILMKCLNTTDCLSRFTFKTKITVQVV